HQACLVRIAHGRFAIRLYPIGMLRSQIVVNLLPELRVCMDLMGPGFIVGVGPVQLGVSVRALDFETNEFHKRLSILGLIAPTPRGNDETSWRVATKGGSTSDA